MTSGAWPDVAIRRRLWIVMILYEAAVISVILAAGAGIALGQGGTLAAAAPLIVIGLAESLRIPLAGWSTRLKLSGKLLAWFALAAIALASFDGLALVFSIFIDNRISNTLAAQHQVEIAQRTADQVAGDVSAFTAEVKELDGQVAALAQNIPAPPPATNKTCTWKGQRVACGPDATSAATWQAAMRAYNARLADLTAKRAASQAKVDAARNRNGAAEALTAAKQALDNELMQSPFHRLVASLYGVRVSDLTEDQFGVVKRFAIVGLAGCFSLLSMLVSVAVHLQPRDERSSKLSRMVRAWLARRRRSIYRDVPGPVQFRDRTIFKYLATDPVSGRVLDPDVKP
jgi:hypothetical protein